MHRPAVAVAPIVILRLRAHSFLASGRASALRVRFFAFINHRNGIAVFTTEVTDIAEVTEATEV